MASASLVSGGLAPNATTVEWPSASLIPPSKTSLDSPTVNSLQHGLVVHLSAGIQQIHQPVHELPISGNTEKMITSSGLLCRDLLTSSPSPTLVFEVRRHTCLLLLEKAISGPGSLRP